MEKYYITGHKNPDLDTICSAMAYAKLKSILDPDNEYVAVRCGHLGESCKNILAALEITPPPYMPDVYPKVKDVMLSPNLMVEKKASMTEIAKSYKDTNPSVTPIFDGGKFIGLLSIDDITAWYLEGIRNGNDLSKIPTVGEVMRDQAEPLLAGDLFEEAKKALSASPKRGLSVFEDGEFIGYVTRRCFLKAPKYNVILMDHNEPRQSIKGIETANVAEIIDHHRLDTMKTNTPIFIDAEPLGSTCTIVYELFVRNKLMPDKETAKLLLTGMMSDTLILKSPTTTPVDVEAAHALAEIVGESVQDFGIKIFSHVESLSALKPEKAILTDFKRYTEKGVMLGIGQCEATTLNDLDDYKDKFLKALEDVRLKNGLDWAVVMITDVMKENSVLLSTDFKASKNLPYALLEEGIYDMPGVMSRKKQLLPEMLFALGM